MYVRVVVYPGAKKESIISTGDNRFEVKVKAPAERNLANVRTKEMVASEYQIDPKKVRLISGHQSPRKIFSIEEENN